MIFEVSESFTHGGEFLLNSSVFLLLLLSPMLVYRDIYDGKALQVCTADHLTEFDVL